MGKMSDAPERICAWGYDDTDRDRFPFFHREWDDESPLKHAPWLSDARMPPTEYVRADALAAAEARIKELEAALNQARLAFAGYVSAQSAIDMIDCAGSDVKCVAIPARLVPELLQWIDDEADRWPKGTAFQKDMADLSAVLRTIK